MVKGYLSQGKVLPFAKHINMSRLFLCNLLSYRRLARWWEYGGNGLFSYVLLYTVGVWDGSVEHGLRACGLHGVFAKKCKIGVRVLRILRKISLPLHLKKEHTFKNIGRDVRMSA